MRRSLTLMNPTPQRATQPSHVFCACLGSAIVLATTLSSQTEPSDQWKSDAVVAWRSTQQNIDEGLEGVLVDGSGEYICRYRNGEFLIESDVIGGKTPARVLWVGAHRYDYWLQKKPSDLPGWTVREIVVHDKKEKHSYDFSNILASQRQFLDHFPYGISGTGANSLQFPWSLPEIVQQGGFQVVSTETHPDNGLLELNWRLQPRSIHLSTDFTSITGSAKVDPDNEWRVHEIVCRWIANNRTCECVARYNDFASIRSCWIPESIEFRYKLDGNEIGNELYRYKWKTLDDSSSFRLSSYGFPEPVVVAGRGWLFGFWGIVLLIGLAFAIASLVIRKVKSAKRPS